MTKKSAPKPKEDEAAKKKAREALRKAAEQARKQEDTDWRQFVDETVRKMGRPTLYEPAYCEQVIRYFLTKPPYHVVSTMFGPKLVANDMPTLAEFAVRIGVSKKTINNWCDEYEEFLRAVEKAKGVQEWIWATNTLHKLYDKTFSIFFGKNNLGY